MGRNSFDYSFDDAYKSCGTEEDKHKPSGKCIENAETRCQWYSMCDLKEKTPWKKPTRPKEYKISKLK